MQESAELLPVPYCHVVSHCRKTVGAGAPESSVVYSILFPSRFRDPAHHRRRPRLLGAQMGLLAVLHTWNQQILAHPHVHCVIPAGGICPTIPVDSMSAAVFSPVKVFAACSAANFWRSWRPRSAHGNYGFRRPSHLANPTEFHRLLRQLNVRPGFVFSKRPFGAGTRHPISGALHASRGHRQWSPDENAKWPSGVPVEGFRRQEPTKADGAGCGRIHSSLPAARLALVDSLRSGTSGFWPTATDAKLSPCVAHFPRNRSAARSRRPATTSSGTKVPGMQNRDPARHRKNPGWGFHPSPSVTCQLQHLMRTDRSQTSSGFVRASRQCPTCAYVRDQIIDVVACRRSGFKNPLNTSLFWRVLFDHLRPSFPYSPTASKVQSPIK